MKKWMYTTLLFGGISSGLFSQNPVDKEVTLQSVEVQGSRFGGLNSGEVKRLEVENNLSSLTGTTAEAIRQIPSLVTDMEGGITFRGSNKSALLLNGVPYGLLEEYNGDMLIQLPSLFFNQISVNSYPPIHWFPDGDAGVINLASSFSAQQSPFTVTLGGGLEERYNAGAILNLHPGKLHILARYNYRHEYRERSFRKTTTNTTGTTEMNNNASARPDIHLADLQLGYDITPNDLLTLYGLYYQMDYSRYGGINNTRRNLAGEVLNKMLRHRFNNQQQKAYAAEARWLHRLDDQGGKLEFIFNYNNFSYDEDNDYKNENPNTGAIVAEDNLFVNQEKHNFYGAINLQKQSANGLMFKAGYLMRNQSEHYASMANNLKEGTWEPNPLKSDRYHFRRTLHLIYLSLEKKWDKLTGEIGLQTEGTIRKTANDVLSTYDNFPVDYNPRLRLTYDAAEAGVLRFQYNRRVIRPVGSELNNFIDRSDATRVVSGNPNLKDEDIHSVELNHVWSRSRFRLSPGVYYRHKRNRIMEVADWDDESAVWIKQNVGHSNVVGVELSASWNPIRLLSVGLSANLFRDEIDGRAIGYNDKKTMTCWDAKGIVNIHITPNTELQLDGFYISNQLTPQGKIKARYSVNAGLSQYLMQRKLRFNLSINNIFDSLEETTLIETYSHQMEQIRNRDARVTWLAATYMF